MAELPLGLSRRRFLSAAGVTAGAVLLGACGGDDDKTAADDDDTDVTQPTSELVLAQFFGGPLFAAGAPLRAPFGIADSEGLLTVAKTPKEVEITVLSPDGEQVGDPITIQRHAAGLERAYFPLEITVDEPGIYSVRAELGGAAGSEMALEVNSAADLVVIQPGAALPSIDTPTIDDARGVTPICTAEPACPLHDVTLAQALTEGKPIALLVATPAFCQVTICGPVLDVLLDARAAHPAVRYLHMEVYADPKTDLDHYAPGLGELGLHLEPALVLVGSDGKVVERLDAIYDADELNEKLGRLA